MEQLKQRILEQSVVQSDALINLDALLNHQVDPMFIMEMGREFAARFGDQGITKVMTIESSGISVGFATALDLQVPMIFARRKKTIADEEEFWIERVPSFTKGMVTDIVVARKFLNTQDRVLIVDDIMANGDAVRGLTRIIERSGAQLVGIGVVVEKAFQNGARAHREQGIRLESLVAIESLHNGEITFV